MFHFHMHRKKNYRGSMYFSENKQLYMVCIFNFYFYPFLLTVAIFLAKKKHDSILISK